ncbi:hypothetical protein IFO68_11835 [Photobacterium sp. CAU 1568]|uniref:Uncharacterized protein n=1 Tax=Photobacterium arenosum TaxID=2774143 RepID=A0ABR9BPI5_9GAMM|nr:hypothetical protein [Photobacterium arenosum]MBD8513366.1 hypothetical protein [Photobacterium arenosum]
MKNIIFLLFFISPATWAGCNNIACYGVGKDAIVNVYLHPSGNIYLGAPEKDKLNCQLDGGTYMTLKPAHPLFSEIYSTILTGIAAQKQMQIRIVENSPECEVMYVTINS